MLFQKCRCELGNDICVFLKVTDSIKTKFQMCQKTWEQKVPRRSCGIYSFRKSLLI